jgi:hypothetical protein
MTMSVEHAQAVLKHVRESAIEFHRKYGLRPHILAVSREAQNTFYTAVRRSGILQRLYPLQYNPDRSPNLDRLSYDGLSVVLDVSINEGAALRAYKPRDTPMTAMQTVASQHEPYLELFIALRAEPVTAEPNAFDMSSTTPTLEFGVNADGTHRSYTFNELDDLFRRSVAQGLELLRRTSYGECLVKVTVHFKQTTGPSFIERTYRVHQDGAFYLEGKTRVADYLGARSEQEKLWRSTFTWRKS